MRIVFLYTAIFILLVIIMFGYLYNEEQRYKQRMMTQYMRDMMRLYDHMQDNIDAIRRFRHDLNKHIATLEYMLASRGYQVADVPVAVASSDYVHHEVINTILMLKRDECREKGIVFACEVADQAYDAYDDIDLVKLIYNLLDNAIEAASVAVDPYVSFEMTCDEQLEIHTKNTYKQLSRHRPKSFRHGIGHLIIQDILTKYHGHYDAHHDNQYVAIDVVLSK